MLLFHQVLEAVQEVEKVPEERFLGHHCTKLEEPEEAQMELEQEEEEVTEHQDVVEVEEQVELLPEQEEEVEMDM
jgi:hypothetical protein